MDNIIKKSFAINFMIMRACGWYPPENYKRLYKLLSFILYLVFIVLVPVLIFLHLILEENIDLLEENYNIAYLAQIGGFITKLLPFIRNGERVKMCINYFEAPCFIVHKEEQRRIINNCVRICRRNAIVYTVGLVAGFTSWNLKPLFWKGRKLPLNIWLPFNPITELKVYCTVYILLAIGISYACLSAIVDPLVGGLAYHGASQLKVLKDNLRHLGEYAELEILEIRSGIQSKKQATKFAFIYGKIKQCVEHHNLILNFTKEYEQCFSLVVFSQFASTVVVIGFLLLQLTMLQTFDFNAVTYFAYIIIVLGEIYFYCYYGTIMFEENNSLTNAIYMSKWYEYDVKSRKALIILMERSKRPMIVTVGKVFDLTVETFTMILRRSYSLLAVLNKL